MDGLGLAVAVCVTVADKLAVPRIPVSSVNVVEPLVPSPCINNTVLSSGVNLDAGVKVVPV